MIKNSAGLGWPRGAIGLALAAAALACEPKPRHPGAYQGVVELDERDLGFEIGGRVISVKVDRGAKVRAGEVLATLDDSLERTSRDSRQAQARVAEADVAVVRAGARVEEIRSTEAQLRASQANESLLEKNLARERALFDKGAVAQASVDDLETRFRSAVAERQSIEQRLRELRNGSRRQEIERAEAQASALGTEVKIGDERIAKYTLRAAENGTVLDRHADPNEVVAAGAPVVTVADTQHPYADVFVPEGEMDGVRVGSGARLEIDGVVPVFPAKVENIGRKTEFTPRYLFSERERTNLVVRVRVRVEDPEERLHAGVPAFVTFDRVAPERKAAQ